VTSGAPPPGANADAPGAALPPVIQVSGWSLPALLAALSMLGPFSIDMYLPAFDAIERDLEATTLAVQQTLSAYLFAYAFMMLWHGALSDALGRRPVVLGGLAIFAFASLGCAIAGGIHSLWLFRILQGLSAGAGLVVGRAIIRDAVQGADAQRLMAQVTLVFGVAPALAPVIGGLLLNLIGWRAIFAMMLLFALGVLAWAAQRLPETLPRSMRQPLHPRIMVRNYRMVLLRVEFLLLASIPTLNFAAFFIYIAAAPTYLPMLGVTTWGFAWLFVPMIAGVMLGGTLSGRLAGRVSARRTVAIGYMCMFAGVALNALIVMLVPPGVPWHVLPIMVFTLGSSLMTPSVVLAVLDLFPTTRGLASSLQGFVQFAFSGVVAGTIAPFLAHSLVGLLGGMVGFSLASLGVWLLYRLRIRAKHAI
jgi:MFS transporter, DHA1 family, multidrug resistance protein